LRPIIDFASLVRKFYQESTIGSGYTLSYELSHQPQPLQKEVIVPSITGSRPLSLVKQHSSINPNDPLKKGIVLGVLKTSKESL